MRELLGKAGFETAEDTERGFDHGTFVPLKLTYPDADVPAVQPAPAARLAHPREEHLLPLMVIAGAAGEDPGTLGYNGTLLGLRLSAYHFG